MTEDYAIWSGANEVRLLDKHSTYFEYKSTQKFKASKIQFLMTWWCFVDNSKIQIILNFFLANYSGAYVCWAAVSWVCDFRYKFEF